MKKTISLLLCLTLLLCSVVPAFAGTDEKEQIPFIFCHGMMGWGEGSPREAETPYWGLSDENNVMTYLRNEGYEVYNPPVSGLGSAWDRACELYAQLTGTRVDYGAAHSEKYGHDRYGRDYTGRATMGEPWNLTDKINLVGHSFGGATVRLLASLLAYGDEEEAAAAGDTCSELFKGGHADAIHAIITLSAPSNGSQVAHPMTNLILPAVVIAFMMNKSAVEGGTWDPMLDQWGLSVDPTTDAKAEINLLGCIKVAIAGDHCGYDMTLDGAAELNKKIRTLPNTYYVSYTAQITEENALGMEVVTSDNVFALFKYSAAIISMSRGLILGGEIIDRSWMANDGIVPLTSALYPTGAPHAEYPEDGKLQTGVWYTMPTMYNFDHYDYCRVGAGFATKEDMFAFYVDLMHIVPAE